MPRVAKGHIEQLPSGSFRVSVYAGTDPLTRRAIRLKSTVRTEQEAHIELGRLLKEASEGRTPESDATVAQLLDQYVSTAGWDVSTRESNLGYIRRTIKPALGSTQVRKVRGPLLDTLYARLMRCGNLACTGKPFIEHRNVPDLRPDPADPRPEWQQAADKLRAAIETGELAPGDALPSVPDLAQPQGLKPGTIRHMFIALAEAGLVHMRHGRTTTVTSEPEGDTRANGRQRLTRPQYRHDCKLSGCKPHVCKPMAKSTIHNIHSILSGAFDAALRWEWVDRNPADSARPPTVTQKKRPATPPADVVNVIDQARAAGQRDIALYLWLAAMTGVRRGELCAVQIADIDLGNAVLHIAFNYVVKAGHKLRKDTKTHQERHIAIDPVTCALIQETLDPVFAHGISLREPAGSADIDLEEVQ
jgi:DNA-binding transcriptional regulator YhcF (GntR family)